MTLQLQIKKSSIKGFSKEIAQMICAVHVHHKSLKDKYIHKRFAFHITERRHSRGLQAALLKYTAPPMRLFSPPVQEKMEMNQTK